MKWRMLETHKEFEHLQYKLIGYLLYQINKTWQILYSRRTQWGLNCTETRFEDLQGVYSKTKRLSFKQMIYFNRTRHAEHVSSQSMHPYHHEKRCLKMDLFCNLILSVFVQCQYKTNKYFLVTEKGASYASSAQ